jgi:mono/diheme cytochrome c family protein
MGLPTIFPEEVCPGGDCERLVFFNPVPGLQDAVDPNTGLRGIDNFENFTAAGIAATGPVTDQALEGERLFQAVGCTACHTPALVSGEVDEGTQLETILPIQRLPPA